MRLCPISVLLYDYITVLGIQILIVIIIILVQRDQSALL